MRRNRGSAGSLSAGTDVPDAPAAAAGLAASRTLSGYDSANEGDAA